MDSAAPGLGIVSPDDLIGSVVRSFHDDVRLDGPDQLAGSVLLEHGDEIHVAYGVQHRHAIRLRLQRSRRSFESRRRGIRVHSHDEHVAEGQAQRDKLISEAQSKAASILAEAEAKGRDEMARLEAERVTLESRISELRQFERDYRSQLRGFIEDKLRDLDVAGTTSGASPVSAS